GTQSQGTEMIEVSETPDCRREVLHIQTDRNKLWTSRIESTLSDFLAGAFLFGGLQKLHSQECKSDTYLPKPEIY
ncbi:MAG: hypothetical protein KAG92_10270, partial [Deltaproteobacteria bacterium]|nr:hypothetical protein [Deltaproteobacteria bacterium]